MDAEGRKKKEISKEGKTMRGGRAKGGMNAPSRR
jgi:hypothetical protein